MDLKDQLTSLEPSKRLRELGVPQDSLFYWNTKKEVLVYSKHLSVAPIDFGDDYYSAFTLAELGEMLPVSINLPSGENVGYCCVKTIHKYICGYDTSENTWARLNDSEYYMVGIAETEADARAMLLIYLIENKLITL